MSTGILGERVDIRRAKGRPMLSWVGKRPLRHVMAFPAQHVETFAPAVASEVMDGEEWAGWPATYSHSGLLFYGDNKDVLAHLLANGFRGKVDLVYIDPPFGSGADYVRKVQLRGASGVARLSGEAYTLGEQVQYEDIWANDNYLQFMYERLLLLRELLTDGGSIYLHCDFQRSHHLRALLEEVWGSDNFRNEIIWKRTSAHSDNAYYGHIHDTIFFFSSGKARVWNQPKIDYDDWYIERYYRYVDADGRRFKSGDLSAYGLTGGGYEYSWKGISGLWRCPIETMERLDLKGRIYYTENGIPRLKQFLDEMEGTPVQSLWDDIQPVVSWSDEKAFYATQKAEGLIERLIRASSNPGGLVLDCFVGSGTTAAVAQRLGRRWIACDVNKGAIQTTSRRLQAVILDQAQAGVQPPLPSADQADEQPRPAQLGFSVYRVNDYDLQVQHNEAVTLACERIGITRTRADSFFDGTLGKKLVKIVPFNHPITLLDLEQVKQELAVRPEEGRDVVVVGLGKETAVDGWLEDWNRLRKTRDVPNKIGVIELRTDPKYGGFIVHEPARARVSVQRVDGAADRVCIEIEDFISPTIIDRLRQQAGVLAPQIDDWRAMVDSVMIDVAYDGQVFNVALSDVPESKSAFVQGCYELAAPEGETTVAVKVTDMLGEEVLVMVRV